MSDLSTSALAEMVGELTAENARLREALEQCDVPGCEWSAIPHRNHRVLEASNAPLDFSKLRIADLEKALEQAAGALENWLYGYGLAPTKDSSAAFAAAWDASGEALQRARAALAGDTPTKTSETPDSPPQGREGPRIPAGVSDLCECGHTEAQHEGVGCCQEYRERVDYVPCLCGRFRRDSIKPDSLTKPAALSASWVPRAAVRELAEGWCEESNRYHYLSQQVIGAASVIQTAKASAFEECAADLERLLASPALLTAPKKEKP